MSASVLVRCIRNEAKLQLLGVRLFQNATALGEGRKLTRKSLIETCLGVNWVTIE